MRSKLIVVLAILILGLTSNSFSQSQEISKSEYFAQATRGFDMMESGPYRVTRMYIRKSEAEDGDVISETTEYQTMYRFRRVGVLKAGTGTKREEYVHVDGRDFTRTDKGRWKEDKGDGGFSVTGGSGTGGGSVRDIKQVESFRRLPAETINGQEVQVMDSLKNVVEGEGTSANTSEYCQRLWIAKNGRILKAESRSTHDGIVTDHTMSEYVYDPKIRVAVPRN